MNFVTSKRKNTDLLGKINLCYRFYQSPASPNAVAAMAAKCPAHSLPILRQDCQSISTHYFSVAFIFFKSLKFTWIVLDRTILNGTIPCFFNTSVIYELHILYFSLTQFIIQNNHKKSFHTKKYCHKDRKRFNIKISY